MVDDIIEYFCPIRYEFYQARKVHQLKDMRDALVWLTNRHRFLQEIESDELIIHKRSEKDIISDLVKRGYASKSPDEPNYDYLLNMNIRSMSQDNIDRLAKEIAKLKSEIDELEGTDESTLWIRDLDRFEQQYKQYLSRHTRNSSATRKK